MQSFPSSIKNDGTAAFKQNYDINKNNEEDKHTYAPKYARIPKCQNNISQKSKQEIAQKNRNTLNSENDEKYEQTFAFNKRKTDSKKITPYIKNNKGVTRRPNSAIGYRNSNYSIKEGGDEATQNLIDFNIESFLETIEIENESTEENKIKPKNTKRKSRTRPNSPRDSSNPISALPQQFIKLPEKKKEKNKTNVVPRSADYSHLNGHELYQNEQNIEKFSTRLTKKSRKDAVLQRSILAKYTQNQVEYVEINKEKKKSTPSEKSVKTNNQDNYSSQTNESDDESKINIINDDSIDFKFNSDASSSTNSSKNKQQQQQNQPEKTDKNKQVFLRNDDKFSHLNFRMTTTVNYNELAKAQSKYTKKIKDVNKSNNNNIKTNDNQIMSKSTSVPPRLFFSRTPLFDDPENPKRREAQRIVTNKPIQNISKEKASSSRIYFHDSNDKKEINSFTPHDISNNKQNAGPTPQTKDSNQRNLPMLNASQQNPMTNLSILPPKLNLNTPQSKSYHNSARKSNHNSFLGINNNDNDKDNISFKKSNKPPMIPNSMSIPSSFRNDSPNSTCSLQPKNRMENLVPIPRAGRSRRQTAAHRSLIYGSEKDSLFLALAKLHNLSDSTSPPTPSSTNSTNNRHQNNQGIFKLNPILPNKKPKDEKVEEKKTDDDEKSKPIDSITFQMTALEKFKKDKKRKQLEEKGIYHYKKETIKIKNDQEENKNQPENVIKNEIDDELIEEEKIEENDSDEIQKLIQSNDTSPLNSNNISSDDFNDTETEQSQNEDTEIDLEELSELTEK